MIWHSTVRNSNICWAFNFGQDPLVRSGQERKLGSRQPSPPTPVPRIPDVRLRCPRVPPLTLYMTCTCKCGGKLGNHPLQSVLRIRDVYPGYRILMFTHPGSRISDPGSKNRNKRDRWKKISCNTYLCSHKFHKIVNYVSFEVLKKQIWDPGSGIGCLLSPGSGIGLFRIPGLRSRIPNSYFCELIDNFLRKKFHNSLKFGPIFFLEQFNNKIVFHPL